MDKNIAKIEAGLAAADAMYAEFMDATRTISDQVQFYKDAHKKVKAAKTALAKIKETDNG
jgi:ABC-type Fe3+-citrate transport system substrate-binding protein